MQAARALPESPPAGREKPACGGMEQAEDEHGGCGQQQADALIAMEEASLGLAPGLALLLDLIAFEPVIHTRLMICAASRQYSLGCRRHGGW